MAHREEQGRRSGRSGLGVTLDEGEQAPPRVVGRVGELLLLAVEEAVWRAVVGDDVVLDPGCRQRRVEGVVVLGEYVLVRARLETGDLLKIRTGRGVYHAENIGADQLAEGKIGEFRSVLFWVNLARKDKQAEPTAQVVAADELPSRTEGGAVVRTLVGPGSPVELGTPGLILDVELPGGGSFDTTIPAEFNAFVWMLEGEASVGASGRTARRSQIAVLGPGSGLRVTSAVPGTRLMLMAGKPYGEDPIYNGPYVD